MRNHMPNTVFFNTVLTVLFVAAAIVLVVSLAFGMYWLAKNVNYSWMYEDMVRQTVREMVKDEALR